MGVKNVKAIWERLSCSVYTKNNMVTQLFGMAKKLTSNSHQGLKCEGFCAHISTTVNHTLFQRLLDT